MSDARGYLRDSTASYFPPVPSAKALTKSGPDSTQTVNDLELLSRILQRANEPTLANFYLGHPQYRLMEIPSRKGARILTLHREGNRVWLEAKELDHELGKLIVSRVRFVDPNHPDVPKSLNHADSVKEEAEWAEIRRMNYYIAHPKVIVAQTRPLTVAHWRAFERLLRKEHLAPQTGHSVVVNDEGYNCEHNASQVLEAHLPNQYYVVADRCSGREDAQARVWHYLQQLSGLPPREMAR